MTGHFRYCLNFKGIEYRTEWVEYPDIENHCKSLGIPPTSTKEDGRPHYTFPAIHDTSTGAYVADSFAIAEYLDKTYADKPLLFPHSTAALQAPFETALRAHVRVLWAFIIYPTYEKLNPPSNEYYRSIWERIFKTKLENVVAKGEQKAQQWESLKENMSKVEFWYANNGGKGPFILGEVPSWADIVVAAQMMTLNFALGEDSPEWRELETWNNGRWKTLRENLRQYETIV